MTGILIGIGVLLVNLIFGLFVVAFADMMLALREIALNTRREGRTGHYQGLEISANIIRWVGWLLIAFGIFIGVIMIFGGMESILKRLT